MPAVFPVDWALIGFAITTLVGVIFGVYPAWKASNLDPIEALRFE
jgi:putative ABC transport system permease protein